MSAAEAAPPRPGPPGSVLVADDNPVNRQMLAELVAGLGHTVTTAENGRQALALLHDHAFDVVLLDVLMPEADGMAVLGRIKSEPRLRETAVIMVSGLGEVDSVVRCIEQGAEDYLIKPFDLVILRTRVNACLEKKRLRDAEARRARELERALEQLRAVQDRLVANQKLASLGALTAGIAHEIRNPLNFVTNFAQLAAELVDELHEHLRGAPGEVGELLAALGQNVAKIQEHGRRTDAIVCGMLLHARGQPAERRRPTSTRWWPSTPSWLTTGCAARARRSRWHSKPSWTRRWRRYRCPRRTSAGWCSTWCTTHVTRRTRSARPPGRASSRA
jgi:CheY-like chemotaxis protein